MSDVGSLEGLPYMDMASGSLLRIFFEDCQERTLQRKKRSVQFAASPTNQRLYSELQTLWTITSFEDRLGT